MFFSIIALVAHMTLFTRNSAQAQEFKRLTSQGGEIVCEDGKASGYDCLNMVRNLIAR